MFDRISPLSLRALGLATALVVCGVLAGPGAVRAASRRDEIRARFPDAVPLPSPPIDIEALKNAGVPPSGDFVVRDMRTGTVTHRAGPWTDPKFTRQRTEAHDVVAVPPRSARGGDKSFVPWSMVFNPASGWNPRNVKIFMSFVDEQNNKHGAVCSGVLIDPLHVLTAGHCVYTHPSFDPFPGYLTSGWAVDVEVIPGYEDGEGPWGVAGASELLTWQSWIDDGSRQNDIGVIALDRPLGAFVGWFGYGYDTDCNYWQSGVWWETGYPAEGPFDGETMWDHYGTFEDCTGNLISYPGTGYGGSSGSGDLNDEVIWGVHTASNDDDSFTTRLTGDKFGDIGVFIFTHHSLGIDLWPLMTDPNPLTVTAGQTLDDFRFTLHNSGQIPINDTVGYDILLATSEDVSQYQVVASHSVAVNLGPNGTIEVVSPDPTIPSSAGLGEKYLAVRLNYGDAVTGNNVTRGDDAAPITVDCAAPDNPTLILPDNGADCVEQFNIDFYWTQVAGAAGYQLWIGESSVPGAPYQVPGLTGHVTYPGVPAGATYYWRVRAYNGCGSYSSWSQARIIHVAPVTSSAIPFFSPAPGDSCVDPDNVLIDWADEENTINWQLRYGTSCGAGTIWVLPTSEWTATALQPGTTYYYQVRGQSTCWNWGNWSQCRTFTTRPDPLAAPDSFWPPDGFGCQGSGAAVSWNAVADADGYEVGLGGACGDSTSLVSPTNVLQLPGLAEGVYSWRVRALTACGDPGPWGPCRTFGIDTTPPTPHANLLAVGHEPMVWSNDNTVHLRWDPAGDDGCNVDYPVQWDNLPPHPLNTYMFSATGPETTSEPLADGIDHWVHIGAKDGAGNFSGTVLHLGPFWIDATAPAVTITDPKPYDHVSQENPEPIAYFVRDNLSMVGTVTIEYTPDMGDTWYTLIENASHDELNGEYDWAVPFVASGEIHLRITVTDHAGNVADTGLRGPIYLDLLSGVDDLPAVTATALGTANPNPFNPSTTIAYTLLDDAHVGLRVYDLQGHLVRNLVDERQTGGRRYEAVWDGRDSAGGPAASGVYLYRFEAGDYRQTRRMSLLK